MVLGVKFGSVVVVIKVVLVTRGSEVPHQEMKGSRPSRKEHCLSVSVSLIHRSVAENGTFVP